MRDYSCSGGSCDSCQVTFDSYNSSVTIKGVSVGDVTLTNTENIEVDIDILNTGSLSQGWWYVGVEFWNVSDPNDPWNTRDEKGRINAYYNAWDPDTSGCDPDPDADVPSGNCPSGVDCAIISDPNGNGNLDPGETIKVRCQAPASFYDSTIGNQRIMFWVHEKDLGQDASNDGCGNESCKDTQTDCPSGECKGGTWWDDALSRVKPANVRIKIESTTTTTTSTSTSTSISTSTTTTPVEYLGDLNNDGKVDITDVMIPALALGSFDPVADVNGDSKVDITDVISVAIYLGNVY